MPNNELNFTTRVDLSGLQSGMAEAATTVQTGAEKMAQAMAAAKTATQQLSEAQKQLGPAAAAGSAQAAAILQEYQESARAAAAAVDALASAQSADTAAATENAAANSAAAAATERVGVSARQGAAAGLGIAEGRFMSANRAAGAFLTTTLGLGPVIQAAFPVIGAFALGEVLVDIGRNAYEAYEKFIDLDSIEQKLYDDAARLKQQDFINVASIEDATKRLHEANSEATNLRETAESLHSLGLQQLFSGNIGFGVAALVTAKSAGDGVVKTTEQSIALDAKKLSLQHELSIAQIEAAHASDGGLQGQQKINAELQKRLELNAEEQKYTAQRDKLEGNTTSPNSGAALKAAQDATARGEARAQTVELARSQYTKLLALEAESGRLIDEEAKKEEGRYAKLREIVNRANESVRTIKPDENDASSGAINSYVDDQIKQNEAKLAATQIDKDNANALAEATVRAQAAEGTTTALGAAHQLAAQHAKEYKEQLDQLLSDLHEYQAAGKDVEAAQTQNQIAQVKGKQQVTAVQDQAAIANQTTQPWVQGANQIAGAWMGAFDNILRGGRNAWDAVQKAGEQTVLDLINDAERYALKWIEEETLAALGFQTTQAQKTATSATANATIATATSVTNTAAVLSYAAVAAAAAAAATAAIPFVGPELAPAAAAATFADTASYASVAAFESGTTYVPRTGMALIHEGEAIFPRPQAEEFRSFLGGGGQGQGGGATSISFNPTFHSGGTMSDARKMMRDAHSQLRRMGMVQ